MPELPPQQKSPEVLQAQLAGLANMVEVQGLTDDAHRIYENIGAVSLHNAPEWPTSDDDNVLNEKNMTWYLREVGGKQAEAIAGRTEMLSAYEKFTPTVDALKQEIEAFEQRGKKHPGFIGEGSRSKVYKMQHDGKDYAVRMAMHHDDPVMRHPVHVIDTHTAAGPLARGIQGMEQIRAASYTDAITVSDLAPGKLISKLSMKEVQQIEPEHLRQLVRTISDATKRGVELDLHRENLLYDPTEGFTIIDYHLPGRYRRSTPGEAVGGVDMPLRTAGKEQILDDKSYARVAKTKNAPERFARQAEHLSVNIELLEKCLTAAKQELSDEEYKAASHEIEDSIDYYQSRQQNLNKFLRTESINH